MCGTQELNCYFLSFKHWFIDINKEDRHIQKIDGHSWQNEKFTFFSLKNNKKNKFKKSRIFYSIFFLHESLMFDVGWWWSRDHFLLQRFFSCWNYKLYIWSASGLCIVLCVFFFRSVILKWACPSSFSFICKWCVPTNWLMAGVVVHKVHTVQQYNINFNRNTQPHILSSSGQVLVWICMIHGLGDVCNGSWFMHSFG